MRLPHGEGSIHGKISGYYSSKTPWTGGVTVREWICRKSFREQFEFGIQTIKQFGGAKYLPTELNREHAAVLGELIDEYTACGKEAASVDYANKKSVRQFNARSDRMRAIAKEIAWLGQDALVRFASVLDIEPAAVWAAHHLVEISDLDSQTLAKCFERVTKAKLQAEAKGDLANAMGEEMWLKERMARKA